MVASESEQTGLLPDDPEDMARWTESGLRRRIIDGQHRPDVLKYLTSVLALSSVQNLGRPSRGINLLRSYVQQVGRLYDLEPAVTLEGSSSAPALDDMQKLLDEAHLWQIAQRHVEYVVGIRESAYRVAWTDRGTVSVRCVTADTLLVATPADDPERVLQIREARLRPLITPEGTRLVACWDVWTCDPDGLLDPRLTAGMTDGDGAGFRVIRPGVSGIVDVTADVIGEEEAAKGYAYRDADGPYLPWQLYHAAHRGQTWSPYELCELVDGTFDLAVLWNKFQKVCRDASWNQRVLIDGDVKGLQTAGVGSAASRRIPMEPDAVLDVKSSNPERPATLGNWPVPIEPRDFAEAVLLYQRTILQTAGIHPADIQRVEGESGYAIQLKRSAQRREAKRLEPAMRAGDLALLSTIARLANTFGGRSLPTEGYGIAYRFIQDDSDERLAEMKLDDERQKAGLLSTVDRMQKEQPGLSEDEAWDRVVRIAIQEAALSDAGKQALAEMAQVTAKAAEEVGREAIKSGADADDKAEEPGNGEEGT